VSIFSKIAGFLGGGAAKAGLGVAEGIADIVERWKPGDAKNVEFTKELTALVNTSYDSARKHDTPMSSGVKWVDATVNGVNRLIRPWVTITVIGSLFGYWNLPPPQNVAPEYWIMIQVILGFWFGGRLVTKDIPAALGHLRK
jgi:hypothetical protein